MSLLIYIFYYKILLVFLSIKSSLKEFICNQCESTNYHFCIKTDRYKNLKFRSIVHKNQRHLRLVCKAFFYLPLQTRLQQHLQELCQHKHRWHKQTHRDGEVVIHSEVFLTWLFFFCLLCHDLLFGRLICFCFWFVVYTQ